MNEYNEPYTSTITQKRYACNCGCDGYINLYQLSNPFFGGAVGELVTPESDVLKLIEFMNKGLKETKEAFISQRDRANELNLKYQTLKLEMNQLIKRYDNY